MLKKIEITYELITINNEVIFGEIFYKIKILKMYDSTEVQTCTSHTVFCNQPTVRVLYQVS